MTTNIFKIKHKALNKYSIEKAKTDYVDKCNFINESKHCPPLIKEWFNSIYVFNKNVVKVLPALDKNLCILVNSYFNLYNIRFDKKMKSKQLRIKKIKSSANKLLISKLNVKHTNDRVNITVYTYNRRKKYYINKIANSASFIYPISHLINKKEMFVLFFKNLKKNMTDLEVNVMGHANLLLKETISNLKEKKHVFSTKHSNKFYFIDYIKKCMYKEILSIRYKQSIYFEESKSENQYLLPLINLIERIYNKKISFNIVNLKYFYNSGSIFSKALIAKLDNRKNKPTMILTTSLSTFELPSLDKFTMYNDMYNRQKSIQNLSVHNLVSNNIGNHIMVNTSHSLECAKDMLDQSLIAFNNNTIKSDIIKTNLNEVIESLRNKFTKGVRIEVAGRLTKRNTAERSMFRFKYKGSVKNSESSHKRLSTVLLRGYSKSNLMYNKNKSKLRVGAFGLKTWVSST